MELREEGQQVCVNILVLVLLKDLFSEDKVVCSIHFHVPDLSKAVDKSKFHPVLDRFKDIPTPFRHYGVEYYKVRLVLVDRPADHKPEVKFPQPCFGADKIDRRIIDLMQGFSVHHLQLPVFSGDDKIVDLNISIRKYGRQEVIIHRKDLCMKLVQFKYAYFHSDPFLPFVLKAGAVNSSAQVPGFKYGTDFIEKKPHLAS